jgi:hypothetical protein
MRRGQEDLPCRRRRMIIGIFQLELCVAKTAYGGVRVGRRRQTLKTMKQLVILWLLMTGATADFYAQDALQATGKGKPRKNWAIFPAGQMPAGTNVTEEEAVKLEGFENQVLYLVGTFPVVLQGKTRVIMRTIPEGTPGSVRVVVDYPPSIAPPAAGTKVLRDATRGFLIMQVIRDMAGWVTIYARDITQPD